MIMRLTHDEMVATRAKIAKINERAVRRGFTGRLAVEASERTETRKNDLGFEVTEIAWDVTITGEPPRYAGWTFAAVLAWDVEAGLIVRTAPGVVSVDRTTLRDGWCEHCKLNRHRNETYLLIGDDGRQVQVGSTCIKDFLGWVGRPVFLSTADVQTELDGLYGGGGGGERRYSVDTVLAVAWAAVQAYGYRRASYYDAGGPSTKTIVMTALDPNPRSTADRNLVEQLRPYVDGAATQAAIIRTWLLSDEFTGNGEYVINLKAVAGADSASMRNVGLLASAPQTWARAMERDLRRRQASAELINEWVGVVGDKIEFKAKIQSIRYLEHQYGTTTLYTLQSVDGYVFKWFASRSALGDVADDTVYSIKGTVKKHEEFQGSKSTVITHAKKL